MKTRVYDQISPGMTRDQVIQAIKNAGLTHTETLSLGAGRQTTGMLCLYPNRYKYAVFADTGGEPKAVYDYLNDYTIPYCKEKKIQFVRVYQDKYGKMLYEYCWDKRIVPSMDFRDCTFKFKILPIRKFYRKALSANFHKHIIVQDIGYSWNEVERMNDAIANKRKPKYVIDRYPLVEDKITTEQCIQAVKNAGLPTPPKSGCWFCPYNSDARLHHLRQINPDYTDKTIMLEENNSRFPFILLRGLKTTTKPIREIMAQTHIKPFDDDEIAVCKSGYCHV